MTKAEKLAYLTKYVSTQGTQVGLSLSPLLKEIITATEEVFVVSVEDNEDTTKEVTTEQAYINAFISAVNDDPLHNVAKVQFENGVVLSFNHMEHTETSVTAIVQDTDGHYTLTLDTTEGHSVLTYTANPAADTPTAP